MSVLNRDNPPNLSEKSREGIFRNIYNFLSSYKLAMVLLIVILACCIAGVTVWRGERAGAMIFGTLWFNSILVALIVNVSFCFFGRIWRRKLTLISFGMILFHLSFVSIFVGIIYNSLFHFNGLIRLTEGETLPNGVFQSYDNARYGRFFSFSRLKGETTLIKMHGGYKVNGLNKRAAYEISVGEGRSKQREIIYLTKNLDYDGVVYLNDSREGYSILTVLYDKQGRELYGGFIPLQSIKQNKNSDAFLYVTGTKERSGSFEFPQDPLKPLFQIQLVYYPDLQKVGTGEVFFRVWPLSESGPRQNENASFEGKAPVGNKIRAGEYYLMASEVRYWAGMSVRYDPGKPIVLASLWVGLAGIVITTIGRLFKKKKG